MTQIRTPPPAPQIRTPPPLPAGPRVKIGDVVYIRAVVVSEEDGTKFLPADYFQLQAVDSSLNPIRNGCTFYLFGNEVITMGEMAALINAKRKP